MIVVVTGGRAWVPLDGDAFRFVQRLEALGATVVRHGGCSGLDTWAANIAALYGCSVEAWPATRRDVFRVRGMQASGQLPRGPVIAPPLWRRWPSAGPLRNVDMVTGAHHVLAWQGGAGTASCRRAGATAGAVVEAMQP